MKKKKILLFIMSLSLVFTLFSVFTVNCVSADDSMNAELTDFKLVSQDGRRVTYDLTVTQPIKGKEANYVSLSYMNQSKEELTVSLYLKPLRPTEDVVDHGNGNFTLKSTLQYGTNDETYTLNSIRLGLSDNTAVVYQSDCSSFITNQYSTCALWNSEWSHTVDVVRDKVPVPEVTGYSITGGSIGSIALPHEQDIKFTVKNSDVYTRLSIALTYVSKNTGQQMIVHQDKSNTNDTFYFDESYKYKDNQWELYSISVEGIGDGLSKTVLYTSNIDNDMSCVDEKKPLSELVPDISVFNFKVTNYLMDTDAPVLNSIKWKSTDVTLPTPAVLMLNATDSGSGTGSFELYGIKNGSGTIEYINDYGGGKREEIDDKGTVNVTSYLCYKRSSGIQSLEIKKLILHDSAGNRTIYATKDILETVKAENSDYPVYELPQLETVHFKEMFDYDLEINVTDSLDYVKEVAKLSEGSYVYLNTSQRKIISKELFDAIKGKDITVVVGSNGLQWVFNGKDITKETKDIDTDAKLTSVNIKFAEGEVADFDFYKMNIGKTQKEKNESTLEQISMQYYKDYLNQYDIETADYYTLFIDEYLKNERCIIQFPENGTLPGKTTIRVDSNETLHGVTSEDVDNLNLYYQLSDDEYELISSNLVLNEDSSYTFDIYHNSTYVMTTSNLLKDNKNPIINEDNSEKVISGVNTKDTTSMSTLVLLFVLSGFTFCFKIRQKLR